MSEEHVNSFEFTKFDFTLSENGAVNRSRELSATLLATTSTDQYIKNKNEEN